MEVQHKVNEFLINIFPDIILEDPSSIIKIFEDFYTINGIKPIVEIRGDNITVKLDVVRISNELNEFNEITKLCEQGKYDLAHIKLEQLIQQNPTNSEYHRVYAQIYAELGEVEKAIDSLIDSLRWDSNNGWALMLMANLQVKEYGDVETAMQYYNQALIANPDDYITMNNIGANLMNLGKISEAEQYLLKALQINNKYPNSYLALSIIRQKQNDLHSAFDLAVKALKYNTKKDTLHQKSLEQAFSLAKNIIESRIASKAVDSYKTHLEKLGNKSINLLEDESIATPAQFEFAEKYKREYHQITYKPSSPAIEHLIIHELIHLDFVLQARKEELNMLFVSNQSQKTLFFNRISDSLDKLRKRGFKEDAVQNLGQIFFEGLNKQIYNTPIDLFIEQFIYDQYPEVRAYQFLSLYSMLQESLTASKNKDIIEITPKFVHESNKVLNIVNAMQFKELFGVDLTSDFQASKLELNMAKEMYEEYLEYKDDRAPAEEYELIKNWAKDLKIDEYFQLIDENEFYGKQKNNVDDIIEQIENDPFDLNSDDPEKEEEIKKFIENHKDKEIKPDVTMYMLQAINFLTKMPKEEVKKIAHEIAMQGAHGYSPEGRYRVHSIANKVFSGYEILAYYYVTWAIALPQFLPELGLPFQKEYELAQSIQGLN